MMNVPKRSTFWRRHVDQVLRWKNKKATHYNILNKIDKLFVWLLIDFEMKPYEKISKQRIKLK